MTFDTAAAQDAVAWFLLVLCWLFAVFLLWMGILAESFEGFVCGLFLLGLAIYCTAGMWPW